MVEFSEGDGRTINPPTEEQQKAMNDAWMEAARKERAQGVVRTPAEDQAYFERILNGGPTDSQLKKSKNK